MPLIYFSSSWFKGLCWPRFTVGAPVHFLNIQMGSWFCLVWKRAGVNLPICCSSLPENHTPCPALDWLPLTLLTVLMCAAHISTISQGNCTSARVVHRSPILFPPQGTFLTVVGVKPINNFGHHDRLECRHMLC